ncbi:MAG: glycerol-3-phosphate acyltransferase [Candidatus Aminicenantales bacterium]
MLQALLAGMCSYMIGSIPFSYIVAWKVKKVDLRVVGEGNVGGRNVFHVVGKGYGALAGFLDFLKGVGAYGLGLLFGLSLPWLWVCGFCAVLGHQFPVFLRGRGGKGAAAALGFLFALEPLMILLAGGLMLAGFGISRNFHVAISVGMASIPIQWRFLFHRSWEDAGILLLFLLFLGLKRLIDEPYMKKIKASSGW